MGEIIKFEVMERTRQRINRGNPSRNGFESESDFKVLHITGPYGCADDEVFMTTEKGWTRVKESDAVEDQIVMCVACGARPAKRIGHHFPYEVAGCLCDECHAKERGED